jgi:hypothetical protein
LKKKYTQVIYFLILISLASALSDINAQDVIERPSPEDGPTILKTFIAVLNIHEIDAASQLLTANVFFMVKWKDPRLVHQGPNNLIKPLKEIWNPNLMIVNRQNITATMPDDAEIQPDGSVFYRQRVFGQFSQTLDYSDFPIDRQEFIIRIVSAGYSPDEIEFTIDSAMQSVISSELTIMDWSILGLNNESKPYSVAPGTSPIASLDFKILAERKGVYYLLNFILPLIVIIFMSMSVFWLHPKFTNPQISIAVTSMLTLIAYRFMIAGSLPKIPYLTRMDIFIFCSTILIFITLAEAILIATLTSKGKDVLAGKIDIYSRWVFPLVYVIIFIIAFVI